MPQEQNWLLVRSEWLSEVKIFGYNCRISPTPAPCDLEGCAKWGFILRVPYHSISENFPSLALHCPVWEL